MLNQIASFLPRATNPDNCDRRQADLVDARAIDRTADLLLAEGKTFQAEQLSNLAAEMRGAVILGASGGKVAAITPAQAAQMMAGADAKFDAIKRLIGPPVDVIDVCFLIDPGMAWSKAIEWMRRPAVVVVGDDPGTPSGLGGADAWRCASRLRRWTPAALVHGAAAQPEHYSKVVQVALKLGVATLIETTSANLQGWAEALRYPRMLLVKPRGGVHPVHEAEAAQ
jgi:hypothetical protein